MASLSLTKARPIQTDRWLYFHAREFRKRPSRFIIWHAVTKPTRPNPRIFAIFKSTDACHCIIHARYTVKTDIFAARMKIRSRNVCKFQFANKPLSYPTRRQCTVTLRCNFHVALPKDHGIARWMPNQFGIHGVVLSIRFNRHLYLTFPNSKDVIPRTDYPTTSLP